MLAFHGAIYHLVKAGGSGSSGEVAASRLESCGRERSVQKLTG